MAGSIYTAISTLSLSSERVLKLMDYEEGSFQDFTGHSDRVDTVLFSPSGKCLFSASDSAAQVWDVMH